MFSTHLEDNAKKFIRISVGNMLDIHKNTMIEYHALNKLFRFLKVKALLAYGQSQTFGTEFYPTLQINKKLYKISSLQRLQHPQSI